MNKKATQILFSILHICILCICLLAIYFNRNADSEAVIARISSDAKVVNSQTESEPETHPKAETGNGNSTDTNTELDTEIETEANKELEAEAEAEANKELEAETETEANAESESETEVDAELEKETEIIAEGNTDLEAVPMYSFHYIGKFFNLNIRSAPSTDSTIVGKIPLGGNGNVLELSNEEWALIEYGGLIGYCSRRWIELQEIDN